MRPFFESGQESVTSRLSFELPFVFPSPPQTCACNLDFFASLLFSRLTTFIRALACCSCSYQAPACVLLLRAVAHCHLLIESCCLIKISPLHFVRWMLLMCDRMVSMPSPTFVRPAFVLLRMASVLGAGLSQTSMEARGR